MNDEMDYTVTLTAKDLEFRERARAAGIPSMLVSMYAGALQKLVESEPRPWVGLTDEEIHDAFQNSSRRSIYRVIEAKLRSKNT